VAAARKRLAAFNNSPLCRVIRGDLFLTAAGLNSSSRSHNLSQFDAVIGNPPYVRYQSDPDDSLVMPGSQHDEGDRLQRRLDVRTVIRCCLLASALREVPHTVRDLLEATEGWRADRDAPDLRDPAERDWVRLVTAYSGLADLALPVWLMTRALCKPEGLVAFVTTESIYNRMYGSYLRYFMLRYMQPVAVIAQEGRGWFSKAQVRAVITVVRRRKDAEARLSISEREVGSEASVPYITLHRHMNLSSFGSLAEFARRSGFTVDSHKDASALVANAMMQGRSVEASWSVRVRSEKELTASLVSDLGLDALARLEAGRSRRQYSTSLSVDAGRAFLNDVVGQRGRVEFKQLAATGIEVHQGLRTGCNRFFYLSSRNKRSSDEWAQWAGASQRSVLSTHSDLDRTIRLMLPGENEVEIPMRYVRPVIKSRSEARRWQVEGRGPSTFLLLTGHQGRGVDLAALEDLPASWLRGWRTQGSLPLPRALENYIDAAENWWFAGPKGNARVFDLSAVAPNVRIPRTPAGNSNEARPATPRWWYSLELKGRHVAPIFVSRVNGERVEAFANRAEPAFVIDANFSTVVPSSTWSPAHLLAYLNSVFVAAWLEERATPMGGGALKVEAAHLRQLPVPQLCADTMRELGAVGSVMMRHPAADRWEALKEQASVITMSGIFKSAIAAQAAYATVLKFATNKRAARSLRV
jgi:hypothetical protein